MPTNRLARKTKQGATSIVHSYQQYCSQKSTGE
jgi:hypothetical protein